MIEEVPGYLRFVRDGRAGLHTSRCERRSSASTLWSAASAARSWPPPGMAYDDVRQAARPVARGELLVGNPGVVENAMSVAGPVREVYLVGPRDARDPAAWRTEIGRPVFRVP